MADTFKPDFDALLERGEKAHEALDDRLKVCMDEAFQASLWHLLERVNEDDLRAMAFVRLNEAGMP